MKSPGYQGKGILTAWRAVLAFASFSMLVLAGEHFYSSAVDPSFDLCKVSAGIGCSETIRHPLSSIALLPVAVWALAVYSVLWNLGPGTWNNRRCRFSAFAVLCISCISSLFFLFVIWRDFEELCPLCITAHGCNFALLLIAVFWWKQSATEVYRLPRPLSWLLIPPLIIISTGYFLVSLTGAAESKLRVKETLTESDMIFQALTGDYDRFYIGDDFQQIAGKKDAKHRLIIIGSLACRHCRSLLSSLEGLTPEAIRDVRIFFLPYPLSPACNKRYAGNELHSERCALEELTLKAQREGRFREWFQKVYRAPGRSIRSLRATPSSERKWDPLLIEQINRINVIPFRGIPLLLWDGQRLPTMLNTLPIGEIIQFMKDFQNKHFIPLQEECEKC